MPFTLAHPAAVLPMMRRPFVGLALVCGALAPDIPYYLRAARIPVSAESWYEPLMNATASHSPLGLLTVALPLALVLNLLLLATAPPLAWLVHGRKDSRPRRPGTRGWSLCFWVPVSLLVGAITHLLWDSLASSDGLLASRFTSLNAEAIGGLSWVDLLQHGSSLVGVTVIAVVAWRRRHSLLGDGVLPLPRAYWAGAALAVVALVAGAVSVLTRFDPSTSPTAQTKVVDILSIALMGGGAAVGLTLILATAAWWVVRPKF